MVFKKSNLNMGNMKYWLLMNKLRFFFFNTLFPVSGLHSPATLRGAAGDKGLGLKINKWNWVHGLVECASVRLLPGSAE